MTIQNLFNAQQLANYLGISTTRLRQLVNENLTNLKKQDKDWLLNRLLTESKKPSPR